MAYKLRSGSEIYIIGYEEFQILGCKLPSIRQALQVFFYNHRTVKLNIRQSAKLIVQEAAIFWDKAKIFPIRKEQHCIEKIEKYFSEWMALSKNKFRKSDSQKIREKEFEDKLDNLFDIAHADALNKIDDIGKQFLNSQRSENRQGLDKKCIIAEKRKSDKIIKQLNFKRRCENEVASFNGKINKSTHFAFNAFYFYLQKK